MNRKTAHQENARSDDAVQGIGSGSSPFGHILVPVDGSDASLEAFQKAIRMAAVHRLPVAVLYVVDDRAVSELAGSTGRTSDVVRRQMETKGWQYLEHVAQIAETSGVSCERLVRRGIPHSQIAGVADELGADLIVMGEHRPRNARRPLAGSLTERVIEYASCSVLVVRAGWL